MPSIKITDDLGVNVDVEVAPASSWLKYAQTLPGMVLRGDSIQNLQLFTLADPAVKSLQPSLGFEHPVSLGKDAPELTIQAEAGGSFRVIKRSEDSAVLFSPDDYGENIEIPAGACYVAVGVHGSAGVGVDSKAGALKFGIDAGAGMAIESYREFPDGAAAPTLIEALRSSIADFVVPAGPDDFEALPTGGIVTITGTGTLKFSGAANLLAIANPLATVDLPGPLPELSLKQGASVKIGASWKISTEYQVRVRKTGAGTVRLGWYRKHGSEVKVSASASAGVSAPLGESELISTVISAVSKDAAADLEELRRGGLTKDEAQDFHEAVARAVNRKLELSLAAEFGLLSQDEAAFLYEVDLGALDDTGREAISTAIAGDLSILADLDSLPAGITGVRSIFSKVRESRWSFKINLLGIFNFGSVSKLALKGKVTFTPSTGELVITDKATASRFVSASVNFGADEEKLRQLMAESFLITAAYRGSRAVVAPPQLSSSHLFFRLDNSTDRSEIRRAAAIAAALDLSGASVPATIDDFGRTSVLAEARYDDDLAHALFLHEDGSARSVEEYETAGRNAIQFLVLPDGDDAFRLRPATDDALWERMKDLGPANFHQLFKDAHVGAVRADYLAIRWWADTMRGTAEILVRMNQNGDDVLKLRDKLAKHLRDVADKAHEQFGSPWGLVAMFIVSGNAADAEVNIAGPRFAFAARRALRAAV